MNKEFRDFSATERSPVAGQDLMISEVLEAILPNSTRQSRLAIGPLRSFVDSIDERNVVNQSKLTELMRVIELIKEQHDTQDEKISEIQSKVTEAAKDTQAEVALSHWRDEKAIAERDLQEAKSRYRNHVAIVVLAVSTLECLDDLSEGHRSLCVSARAKLHIGADVIEAMRLPSDFELTTFDRSKWSSSN
ncbi:MAG: hypothetical protein ABJ360_12620 [Roseobacter sp.]